MVQKDQACKVIIERFLFFEYKVFIENFLKLIYGEKMEENEEQQMLMPDKKLIHNESKNKFSIKGIK